MVVLLGSLMEPGLESPVFIIVGRTTDDGDEVYCILEVVLGYYEEVHAWRVLGTTYLVMYIP